MYSVICLCLSLWVLLDFLLIGFLEAHFAYNTLNRYQYYLMFLLFLPFLSVYFSWLFIKWLSKYVHAKWISVMRYFN